MKKKSKAKKWPLFTAIGVTSVLVVGAAAVLLLRQPNQAATQDENCKNRSCQRGVSGFIGSLIWYRNSSK